MVEMTIKAKDIDGFKFLYFYWNFEEITDIENQWTIELKRYRSDGIIRPKNEFFAVYEEIIEEDKCLAEGTMITLADGTQKAVEQLTGNEKLLVWNLLTGEFDIAPMVFIDSDLAAL